MFVQALRIFALCTICLLLGADLAAAQSYSWTDNQGNKFYGSNPPRGAKNVNKLKGGSFSRYSASKALAPYQNQISRAQMAPEKSMAKTEDSLGAPLAAPSLEQGKITMDLSPENLVTSCLVDVKNSGQLDATNVTVSFEFVDGTIIQAKGPEKITGGETVQFSIPKTQLPVTVALEEGALKIPEPSIIMQFSEAS
ncbi:MAG: DUF4124 domain-containing protein [Bdellovibrionales bacterium]|nr:DUF4124 domain-containing protein [Bdellovibrionales bacterium]